MIKKTSQDLNEHICLRKVTENKQKTKSKDTEKPTLPHIAGSPH